MFQGPEHMFSAIGAACRHYTCHELLELLPIADKVADFELGIVHQVPITDKSDPKFRHLGSILHYLVDPVSDLIDPRLHAPSDVHHKSQIGFGWLES